MVQILSSNLFLPPVISNPSKFKRNYLVTEINANLLSGSISEIPFDNSHFVSRVFTVPKKNGGHRLVIDLSALNKHIVQSHFKMEDKEVMKSLINPSDYLASIDLRNAFHSIKLHPDSKKFVVFEFEGRRFCFNVLPFGLTSAPRVFTKVLKPVISHLRSLGIKITSYLDDLFICGPSFDSVKSNLSVTTDLLISLGFSISWEKSSIIPSQRLEHLGFIWDSVSLSLGLPISKLEKIKLLVNRCLSSPQSLRFHASLLGLFVNSAQAFKFAPLFYRKFQLKFAESLKTSSSWEDTLEHFLPSISNKVLSIRCDNTTAIFYLNKLGGTHSKPLSSCLGIRILPEKAFYCRSCLSHLGH